MESRWDSVAGSIHTLKLNRTWAKEKRQRAAAVQDAGASSALPLDNHRRANGEAAAFGTVDGEAAGRDCILRNFATQPEAVVLRSCGHLRKQIVFDECVHEITIRAGVIAQMTEHAAGVVRMIAQHA